VFIVGSDGIVARNLAELWLRLDELSNRVQVIRLEDLEASDAPTTEQTSDEARPRLSPAEGFAGDLRELSDHLDMLAGRAAVATDPATILESAVEEFGEGRAGAGGIALYKPAELPTDLTGDRIREVAIVDGQLQLRLTDRVVALPPVDLDLVAVAYLSVYEGQGTYKGKIVAETSNALVIQTGKGKFGEVVWKKEFMSTLPVNRTKGTMVSVEFGPGLGLLAEIAPSVDRVTYYGAIRGTRMGDIFLRSDELLATLVLGVDRPTARPVEVNLDGFQSRLERVSRADVARLSASDQSIPRKSAAPPRVGNEWWEGVSWFVWVPERVSLKWNAKGNALEFANTKMKLDAWVADGEASEVDAQFAHDVTEKYGELRSRYPVLADLERAAQAVAIVRSLKARNVPWKDPTQIQQLIGEPVTTPDNVPRITVLPSEKFINGATMPEIRKRTQP